MRYFYEYLYLFERKYDVHQLTLFIFEKSQTIIDLL